MNIAHSLDSRASRAPAQPALISSSGNLTYEELSKRSGLVAAALKEWGIETGMRVVLMVRPGPDFLITTFAFLKLGAVLVLVDPGIGRTNLDRCLAEAEPQAFAGIWKAQAARYLLGWCKETVKLCLTTGAIGFPGAPSLRNLLRKFRPSEPLIPVEVDQHTPAAIAFTSGSTGVPKGVVYTHGMFAAQAQFLRSTYQIEENEVDLATFPLFALYDPALGMTTVFPKMDFSRPGSVNPGDIVDAVRTNQVTHMFGSPALLDRVGRRYASDDGIPMPSIRRVLSAGAPVPTETLDRFSRIISLGAQIHTPYGATEALPVCSISSREREALGGTSEGKGICVGRPLKGVDLAIISITDDPIETWTDELCVPDGEIGEIVVWGDNVSREYFNRPEHNRLAKIRDER
ncbi:MAG TPA: AMP-binding protein, partial [Acidobacteriota bacterium]|nr:AMP-binding protein [Acidobacteriota bacterium]